MLVSLAALAVTALPLATQQDAPTILETQRAREQARWAQVENFTVEFRTEEGVIVPVYRKRIQVDGEYAFYIVPPPEWEGAPASPEDAALMAGGMADAIERFGPQAIAALPAGPLGLGVMNQMGNAVRFLRAGENYERYDPVPDIRAAQAGARALAERARLAGRETINGRPAFHIVVDDMSGLVPALPDADGNQFRPTEAHAWVDTEHYVTLRSRVVGQATVDGNETVMTVEETRTYQSEGPLYEPMKREMAITGLAAAMNMTPQERRDLERAQREVAQMRAQMAANQEQLAQLPQGQRDMIMNRLNRAVAQLEAMASGGAIEATTTERIIAINEGPPFDWIPGGG